jgi:8-oxo-dGTP pyrophosphatase MutT (NUDIX family)
VFPGGRIDADDHRTAQSFDLPDAAARIAAIRETIEETGLTPGLVPAPDPALARTVRDGIVAERPLADLLAAHGLALDLEALTPFARWCPNFRETRRFDTLFFLAEASPDMPDPVVAEAEAVRAFWASAAEVLAEVDTGLAHVIFPTRRNLERLARFASIAEIYADARRHPVMKITPWVAEVDGTPHVCIPEGMGYPVTSEPLATALRR